MTTRDLGNGIRVSVRLNSSLEVVSERIELPWTVRAGDHPGTAIVFEGVSYEAVSLSLDDDGVGWRLEPWTDGEAMRVVMRLDRDEVAGRRVGIILSGGNVDLQRLPWSPTPAHAKG